MRTTIANPDDTVGATSTTHDLWLVFSPISNRQAFISALCALYYLPEQYKLMVDSASHEVPIEHQDLMNRVEIAGKRAELSEETAPFAFIYEGTDRNSMPKTAKKTPTVVMTDRPEQYVKDNEWDGFTVPTETPEALASAILNIARNSLYNGLRLVKQPFAG